MIHPLLLALAIVAPPAGAVDSMRADQDVREAVLRNSADVRRCYEREGLTRDPSLRGTVEVELTILPTGLVERVGVDASALKGQVGGTEIGACIATAARNWRFERGPYGVETVVFPFALAPLDRAAPAGPSPTRG